MELFLNGTSPYARVTRIVAIEKGLIDSINLRWVDPWNDDASLLEVNPIGRIPALRTDEGVALSESLLICQYLDGLREEPCLLPQAQQAEVLALAGIGQGLMDAAFNTVIMRKHHGADVDQSALGKRRRCAMERGLRLLEERLATTTVAQPLLGDITVAVALSYIDFRLPEIAWHAAHPRLAAWAATVQARPSFIDTRFG